MTHEHHILSFTPILPESEVVTEENRTDFILPNGQWTIFLGRCISLISMNFCLYHYIKTITLALDYIIDLDVQQ